MRIHQGLRVVFGAVLLFLAASVAEASTYTVTNLNDADAGSLRQAILDANAHPGPDRIEFAIANGPGTIGLRTGSLVITDSVTIDGSTQPGMKVSGSDTWLVFSVNAPAAVEIIDLTIRDGISNLGGGVLNTATLTLTRCTVRENTSTNVAGGILNLGGSLTLVDSTVISNTAPSASGGGIFNNSGTVTLTRSTVSGNSANLGGGFNNLDQLVVTGSTIWGNTSATTGGGILNLGTATITNSTISQNTATTLSGGGITNDSGTVIITSSTLSENASALAGGGIITTGTLSMLNTIVANSAAGGDCFSSGVFNDLGHNIVEDGSCISHATSMSGDSGLGLLADNGGGTLTHALLAGSIAIDAGDCGAVTTDQRGIARPQGPACDIGAFEVEVPCPPDLNADGVLDFFDVQTFLNYFVQQDPRADFAPDGIFDFFDVLSFLNAFAAGCR